MSKAEELADKLNGLCVAEFAWGHLSNAATELRRLQAELERLTAENAELRKDAARWQQIAYMESGRVAPEILADYIAKPERLDYAAELRKHHDKAMK